MATQPRIAVRPVRTIYGTPLTRQRFLEAQTQTFKAGAFVYLSGGYLNECGADPALVVGIATRDGQNGASDGAKAQEVIVATPGTLFLGNYDNGSGTVQTAQTIVGVGYGIAKDSGTGTWYVDSTDTSNDRVVIWEIWDGDGMVIGDYLGWVIFSLLPTVQQMHVGA